MWELWQLMELGVLGVLVILATWQTVVTWNRGTLFERPRAWAQARPGLLSELLLCPFCLTHWIAGFWVSWVYLYIHVTRTLPLWQLLLWPLCVLAATRMAVTAHDLLYKTENYERKEEDMITAGTVLPNNLLRGVTVQRSNALRWLRKKDGTTVLQQAWVEMDGPGVEWRDVDVFEESMGEGVGDGTKVPQNTQPLDNGSIH